MTDSLRTVAHVKVLPRRAIISLIGNVQRSSLILEKVSQEGSRAGNNSNCSLQLATLFSWTAYANGLETAFAA
jgi:hypothetical protein